MFHRIGGPAYKADLKNIISLCKLLGNPQNNFSSIHVAGTNGKGSTSHMLASVLQECGYKTGLFTSPHLKDFRERIRINGKMIPKSEVTDFVSKMKDDFQNIRPSFFEMTTALAFDFFSKKKVDVAVIETGLGGRLDSTNIIRPMVSVITNISFDHQQFLGNTLAEIAKEKAGIIKKQIPVVIGETQKEIKHVFLSASKQNNSKIFFADELSSAKNLERIIPLKGSYQKKNLKTVLQTIKVLKLSGMNISRKSISSGISKVIENTGLKGRWQTLSKSPLTICDVVHNKGGIREVVKQLENTPHNTIHFVLGMVNDKDHAGILELLPQHAVYYFCKPDIPRGLNAEELKLKAAGFKLSGESFTSVKLAYRAAIKNAKKEDLIFIGGSTFVVAGVL